MVLWRSHMSVMSNNYIYPLTIVLVKIYESSLKEKLSFVINKLYVFAIVKIVQRIINS
jgi:hypothetical protein